MKIVTVIGARPQFIKASVVSHELSIRSGIDEVLVHTGQHYDAGMSDVFFSELGIPEPNYNLGISGGSHGLQTGRMLEKLEEVLLDENPDLVILYGDTNSTLAGALASVKLHIPIAHIEAGLRSFNQQMPEEVNRILTDHCSKWLFAPTQTAVQNLQNEGLDSGRICLVGDVMYDVAKLFSEKAKGRIRDLTSTRTASGKYILATVHRAENTDNLERLTNIFQGLQIFAQKSTQAVILPLHPRTKKMLTEHGIPTDGLDIIDPVGFLDMVALEKNAELIVTDSGGVQKEAYFHGRPCVTLRDETEWVELLESGWNRLCPPGNAGEVIADSISGSLNTRGSDVSHYGSGNAASIIVDHLVNVI